MMASDMSQKCSGGRDTQQKRIECSERGQKQEKGAQRRQNYGALWTPEYIYYSEMIKITNTVFINPSDQPHPTAIII